MAIVVVVKKLAVVDNENKRLFALEESANCCIRGGSAVGCRKGQTFLRFAAILRATFSSLFNAEGRIGLIRTKVSEVAWQGLPRSISRRGPPA